VKRELTNTNKANTKLAMIYSCGDVSVSYMLQTQQSEKRTA